MANATLYPGGNHSTFTAYGWTSNGDGTYNKSTGQGSYIVGSVHDSWDTSHRSLNAGEKTSNTAVCAIDDTPTDFAAMTAITARFASAYGDTWADDTELCEIKITNAAETTDYVAWTTLFEKSDGVSTRMGLSQSLGLTLTAAGMVASKADWDAARLHVRLTDSATKGSDGSAPILSGINLYITYDAAVTLTATHSRFRNDDGSESAATWLAAANTDIDVGDNDQYFRLRMGYSADGAYTDKAIKLQFRKNGGSWTDIGSATDITYGASSWFTDGAATTQQLTSGTFVGGVMCENSGTTNVHSISGAGDVEIEWMLWVDSTKVTPGDYYEFQAVHGAGNPVFTNTEIPRLDIETPAIEQTHYRFRADDGSETAATWLAATNTDITLNEDTNGDYPLRLRIGLYFGQRLNDIDTQLQFRVNGAIWADVGTTTAVRWNTSSYITQNGLTTQQITSGAFHEGRTWESDPGGNGFDTTEVDTGYVESEFSLILMDGQLSAGDYIEFRQGASINGVRWPTMTQTPRIDWDAGGTTDRQGQVTWAEMEVPDAPRQAQVTWAEMETPDGARQAQVTWTELEIPTAPRTAIVTWAEAEIPTAPRTALVTWAELETPDAPRQAQVTWAELETPDGARQAQVTWAELETGDAARQAQVTWAEFEVPTNNRRAWVTWSEIEIPDGARQAQVTWAELETGDAARQAQVTWAELETGDAARQGQVTWAELETPDGARQGQVTWAELEIPDGARSGVVSWAEMETTDPPRQGQVTWAELEVPDGARQAQVTWAEIEIGDGARQAQVTWSEMELPDAPRQAQVTWAEMEIADAGSRTARATWAEMEVPTAPRQAQVTWSELETPDGARQAQVTWAELEVGDGPRTARVTWAEIETGDAARRAVVSWSELEVPSADRTAQVTWGELEVPTAPRTCQVTWAEMEVNDAPRTSQVTWAEFEVPAFNRMAIVTWAQLEVPDGPSGPPGPPINSWFKMDIGR